MALLIGKRETAGSAVFDDYVEHVANDSLLPYKTVLQHGNKQGQSLYMHVLDGVMVLETLREPLGLSDAEARVLYTAFTVHDLNKAPGQPPEKSFSRLATTENITAEIERLGLAAFLPDWQTYLADIESLIRGHSGHYHVGGEMLIPKRAAVYTLGMERVATLIKLMQAADVIDLSHTLTEQAHKQTFLSHLNTYLAESGQNRQYEFVTHQLTEQRGLLTNVIHNSLTTYLSETYNLIPLLYYPDGVAYLIERGREFAITANDLTGMAGHIAETISDLTTANFREFINSTGQGIKVDDKCLELGIPFKKILDEIYNLVQRRKLDPVDLDAKARDWAQRGFEKAQKQYPQAVETVQAALDNPDLLVSTDLDRLRLAELVRSYYVFLNKHFRKTISDAWEHIYPLLDLPPDRFPYYAYFDALWVRAYVISTDLTLNEEEVYQRLLEDGRALTAGDRTDDPKTALLTQYLDLYALFSRRKLPSNGDNGRYLAHYVTHQHKQCVYCSGPFPTDKWMTADVRSDITVQSFSNRLRGGPGEPKKHICAICQLQFMLEKLNYPEIRGEKTLYLHLYPYSFLTKPYLEGLQSTIRRIVTEDTAVQALNMNVPQAIDNYLESVRHKSAFRPIFRHRTKKDKPQPYGLYLPRYSETVGNVPIFPLNPGGANDTERFLFTLWNALLLQRHFGLKVILSNAAVPPLEAGHTPDLFVDNIPLACQGLLPHNDYLEYRPNSADIPGPLEDLWQDVAHLFKLRSLTATTEDKTPRLVRALLGSPLNIFYETERLLEARLRGPEQGGLLTWLFQQALPHVEKLSLNQNRGGSFMSQLSTELRQLAALAWQSGLRGSSLKKSALLFPVNEVFQKLRLLNEMVDRDTLKAAAAQDIFDHLDRIADDRYKPGRKKQEAVKRFVDGWFDDVLEKIYGGNERKLLNDEKLIRSAYHFYIRDQIPRKEAEPESEEAEVELEGEV